MLSFKKLKKSRLFAHIINKKDGKTVQKLYVNEKYDDILVQDTDFRDKIEQYATIHADPTGLIHSFELKDGYLLENAPPEFDDMYEREVSYLVAKAGSGKSFLTAKYVEKYHEMNPDNRIYYVSVNKITNDKSFDELLKKKSFQKVFGQINLMLIRNTIDFSRYTNCLFIFDDVIDVDIPVDIAHIIDGAVEDTFKRETGKLKPGQEIARTREEIKKNLSVLEMAKLSNVAKKTGALIKKNIMDSLLMLLKAGRKNRISVLCTNHDLFSSSTPTSIMSESHKVILFPYGNVSMSKLKDFLTIKLSFDKEQADFVVKNSFKKYEALIINVNGMHFYFTSKKFQFL